MISIPFTGSKKYSYKNVRFIAENNSYNIVYEPFGGSCILSVNLLNEGLVNKAVVNDYDHFFDLYPEYLDMKDKVVEECYKRGLRRRSHDSKGCYIEADEGKVYIPSFTLNLEERAILQDVINTFVPQEYWTYFSLGSNFMHSGRCVEEKIELKNFAQFKSYLKTDKQRKYLKVLEQCELNNLDWKDFFKKYEIQKDDLLILDPPYIETRQGQYKGQFTEKDTLDLIEIANNLPCDYIFFNHDIKKVEGWLKGMNFKIQQSGNAHISANRKRLDVMAYIQK